MKKMMIAAMMLLASSASFAGNSDVLKAILKAKTYTEAAQLLSQTLNQLADNAEKASAYNHLTQLALKTVQADQAAGQESAEAYEAVGNAFTNAQECVKYDALPDAKGKVKNKYAGLADQLYMMRGLLINGGVFFQNANDDANAYKYLAEYVETAGWPMFAKFDISKDENLGNIAYYAAYYAYQKQEWEKAEKYISYAQESAKRTKDQRENAKKAFVNAIETHDWNKVDLGILNKLNWELLFGNSEAVSNAWEKKDWQTLYEFVSKPTDQEKQTQQLELAILGAQLKTHEDSVNYANKLEQKLAEDPENVSVFTLLVTTLSNIGEQAKADQIVEAALSKDPNNYGALVMKGQFESQKKNYEAAADALVKALPLAADDAQRIAINASIGQCYFYHAQEAVARVKGVIAGPTKEQFDKVYNKAIEYLLVAKNLDVNHESKRLWAYPLYGCYYFVKGEKAPETEAAAADAGISGE